MWPDRDAGDGAGAGAWITLLFGEEKGGCGLKTEGPTHSRKFYRRNEISVDILR